MTDNKERTSYCTQVRARELTPSARFVFNEVLAAMQDAEELGGPDGEAYLDLMQAIIDEAALRQQNCAERLADKADET
ncbi:MAG: hypothetical protein HS101_19900 [Planctomycetia bacterium]|nr:hypothetical protein [Planctomycetia bacterium]